LEAHKKTRDEEGPNALAAMHNLAVIKARRGKPEEAEQLGERAINVGDEE
jgi:Tetratricopeptide repeat